MNLIIQKKGFTLIELLLYVGLAAFILLASSLFISLLLQARIKNQTLTRLETEGLEAMQIINQSLRNATQVNLLSENSLQVVLKDGSTLRFFLENEKINLKKDNIDYPLISSRINTSNLKFINLAVSGEALSIRTEFTLDYIKIENRNETSYTQNFYDTVTIRP